MSDEQVHWSEDKEYFKKRSNLFRKVFEGSGASKSSGPTYTPDVSGSWHAGEYFHALADSLVQSFDDSQQISRVLAFTSCYLGEGVTTITANLAAAIAQNTGQRVVIIDANIGDPMLHTILGADRSPGLSEVVCDNMDVQSVVQQTAVRNLWVLPAGNQVGEQVYQCVAERLPEMIQSLRESFGYVLFDTPSMDGVNHLIRNAHLLDGILLVIETERVRWEVAQRVKERLLKANAPLLGVVLNRKKYHIPRWLYKTL